MKLINLTVFLFLTAAAFAQDVQFDYDRSTDFSAFKTYQWIDTNAVPVADQLLDLDIKRAVDAQLAAKGLTRVESDGDLLIGYQAAISQEKEFYGVPSGPPWWGNLGNTRVTTATIEVGKLVIGLFDPARKQLVWRGSASKTLDIKHDPEKNYRNLEKAVAKLFKNYPPGAGKH